MPEASPAPVSLSEAGQQYLASLQAKARSEQTGEVNRFVRWFGGDRPLEQLLGSTIERYTEENQRATDAQRRFEILRSFFAYAKKAGITRENLGVHVRIRRTGSSSSNSDTINPDRIEMSASGRAALEEELDSLRAQRPKIAEALRTAMADKDFRENAPLDAAREQQAHLEARIRELESMLKRAVVVENRASGNIARMGTKVKLVEVASGREVNYMLVGPGEVNASEGKISVSSPVGKALIDHVIGDEVEVQAPSRTFRYRIESIEV